MNSSRLGTFVAVIEGADVLQTSFRSVLFDAFPPLKAGRGGLLRIPVVACQPCRDMRADVHVGEPRPSYQPSPAGHGRSVVLALNSYITCQQSLELYLAT